MPDKSKRLTVLVSGFIAVCIFASLHRLGSAPEDLGKHRKLPVVLTDIKIDRGRSSYAWTCERKPLIRHSKERLCYRTLPESEAIDGTVVIADVLVSKTQQQGEGWVLKDPPTNLWVRYATYESSPNAVTAIKLLYGPDAVIPLPGWTLLDALRGDESEPPIKHDVQARIAIRKGLAKPLPSVLLNWDKPKIKVLQIADLHMVAGVGRCDHPAFFDDCDADLETVKLINDVLEREQPDFVVFTGDQLFGPDTFDAETALLKALAPVVNHKIPFATVFGNHDREADLSNAELMRIVTDLPYSVSSSGPKHIHGVGNYVVTLNQGSASVKLFMLDSHSMNGPWYDYIKKDQLEWAKSQDPGKLSMVFFHIPVPEYKKESSPESGIRGEGISAQGKNTHALDVFRSLGASVLNVGHDHCNDFCEIDRGLNDDEKPVWLCYGGGGGYGGYGCANDRVYGGVFERRFRVFEIDSAAGTIDTWKRVEHTEKVVDKLTLVTDFEPIF